MHNTDQVIQIAIDGHSSSGKSTLAKDLARELGFIFIDTGAMYRAVTLYCLRNNVDLQNSIEMGEALAAIDITFVNDSEGNKCYLNGNDVHKEIRLQDVSNMVSDVAAIPEVREKLVDMQRKIGTLHSVVMDGRDIGTVVFPDAFLKLFVTADLQERARRRHQESLNKGFKFAFEDVLENLKKRDHLDSTRQHSPLRQAEDAFLIDNTHLNRKEQLELAISLYKKRLLETSDSDIC